MGKVEAVSNVIKVWAGIGNITTGQSLESVYMNLRQPEIEEVMVDLGRELANLHQHQGEGFGWVSLPRLAVRQFRAPFPSWYDFLVETFDEQSTSMQQVQQQEVQSNKYVTGLSAANRFLMQSVWDRRPQARQLIDDRRSELEQQSPQLLNGNIHNGSIYIEGGRFSCLADYNQMLLGDPLDDLAYFSVMPGGGHLIRYVKQGWQEEGNFEDNEDKFHLYRLWEAYRKIFTRYTKHHYLEDYPQPLHIAMQELAYFKVN